MLQHVKKKRHIHIYIHPAFLSNYQSWLRRMKYQITKPVVLRSPMLLIQSHSLRHNRKWWMTLKSSVVCQRRTWETQQRTSTNTNCIGDIATTRITFRKTSCKTRRMRWICLIFNVCLILCYCHYVNHFVLKTTFGTHTETCKKKDSYTYTYSFNIQRLLTENDYWNTYWNM